MLNPGVCRDWRMSWYAVSNWRRMWLGWSLIFVYDTNRPAFLESDLVGLCVDGNWQVWVQYCGELVSIHVV